MSRVGLLNVTCRGRDDATPMVFVHGYGCGQLVWRLLAPAFESTHRVVCLDLPSSADADPRSYDPVRHATLEGYRDDVVTVLRELELRDAVLVGHSVGAVIAVLTQIAAPELVGRLVLLTPSVRYVDDDDYRGGFSIDDVDELVDLIARNPSGWQDPLADLVSGGGETRDDLVDAFCRMRPEAATTLADLTFRGDHRADLAAVGVPTLVVQASHDVVAPRTAGDFVRAAIPLAESVTIDTVGHVPHLSAPAETAAAIRAFAVTA